MRSVEVEGYELVYRDAPVSEANPFGGQRGWLAVDVGAEYPTALREAFGEYRWTPGRPPELASDR